MRMAGNRITALIAMVCAVLGGAALMTATGVLAESGLRSHLPAGRLAGADVVVAADQEFHPQGDLPIALPERRRIPASLVTELSGLTGVEAVAGDIAFPAALVDARGRVVPIGGPGTAGHGWSSAKLLAEPGIEGRAPGGPGEVALSRAIAGAAGVGVGGRVEIVAAGRPADGYRVSAVVDAPDAGILFTDTTAARLSDRVKAAGGPHADTVDLIGLRTAPGAGERVAAEVRTKLRGTGLETVTGAARGDLVSPGGGASRSLLVALSGSLAGIVLLITGFVVSSALAVSVGGQRRDLALMRAVGATPRQVRRFVVAQATVIAGTALVPGVGLGHLLAGYARRMLADQGVVPEALPLYVSPLPAVATVTLVVLAVQIAARCAAWRTSRLPATEAVVESRSEPRQPSRTRTRAGMLVIVAATTLSVVPLVARTALGAAATSLAGIIGAIGLALVGPALVRRLGTAASLRTRPGASASAWLAMSNIRAHALHNAGIVSALAMAVVFVLTYTFAQTTVLAATTDDARAGTLAQQRLTAPELGGLPADTLAAVRSVPGVRAAAPVSSTSVVYEYAQFGETVAESASALVLTSDASEVLDLDVRRGSLDRLTGRTVAVSDDVAASLGAEVGGRVRLVLGDGTRIAAEVVAVYARGLGFGPVALSHDLATGHTTAALDQSILVRTDGTLRARQGLDAFASARPGVVLQEADPRPADGLKGSPPEVWINLAVIVVLLTYLLLNIANKLVASTAQRRTEMASLRLNGTTPAQIRAMVRREAAFTIVTALTTGLLLSAVPLALVGQGFLGRPWPAGPIWLLPSLALAVTVTAVLAVELPARRALHTPPAEACRAQ